MGQRNQKLTHSRVEIRQLTVLGWLFVSSKKGLFGNHRQKGRTGSASISYSKPYSLFTIEVVLFRQYSSRGLNVESSLILGLVSCWD